MQPGVMAEPQVAPALQRGLLEDDGSPAHLLHHVALPFLLSALLLAGYAALLHCCALLRALRLMPSAPFYALELKTQVLVIMASVAVICLLHEIYVTLTLLTIVRAQSLPRDEECLVPDSGHWYVPASMLTALGTGLICYLCGLILLTPTSPPPQPHGRSTIQLVAFHSSWVFLVLAGGHVAVVVVRGVPQGQWVCSENQLHLYFWEDAVAGQMRLTLLAISGLYVLLALLLTAFLMSPDHSSSSSSSSQDHIFNTLTKGTLLLLLFTGAMCLLRVFPTFSVRLTAMQMSTALGSMANLCLMDNQKPPQHQLEKSLWDDDQCCSESECVEQQKKHPTGHLTVSNQEIV